MSEAAPDADHGRESSTGGVSRRAMLAAATGLTVSSSGCIRRVRSIVNRDAIEPLSLTITTLPADGDRESIQLAREIASVLEAVGIDVSIEMRSNEEFLRAILINHDFDVYVGRHPGGTDPDVLYEALHSRYAEEAGWQNPFGFTNLTFDTLLEEQRRAVGEERSAAVATVLEALAVEQPFVPICVPEEYRLVRSDRFDGWNDGHLATRLGYLGLESLGDADGKRTLRVVHTDARPSQNLNPLSVEYRNRGTFTDLLYDSLASPDVDAVAGDGESDGIETLRPWLAADWEWSDDATMTVELREGCRFHDGEPVTTDDVVFTYRFLADTTLGDGEFPSPSPRHRGRVAAVDGVDRIDTHRVELSFDAGDAAAERALTVPVLPEHVWLDRATKADVPGVRVADGTTEALVADNVPPVGSGPFRFVDRAEREHVTFERFDEHFTLRKGVALPEPTVDELRIRIDPRSTSAIELVETESADVTSSTLDTYVLDDVIGSTGDGVELLESPSWTFYHLGFNARRAPFSNPRFRRAVARVIDKAWLVETVFDGYARPIAAPVADEWVPDSLAWNGEDPETPFLGSDGDLDVEAARDAFEAAGFRYDETDRLRVRR
ncbi:ABC transporter substrate-binding protein [Halopiger djelfimassiliensis]|uniref:ABC transporter substrate-binding protein n=1 Tax=Halopiger djelfimassiliensis TaxID=1293047 RepID=UPI0006782731|nr:ABC transporter substrate-binding protein [Halopiger djelfimassiliensis]